MIPPFDSSAHKLLLLVFICSHNSYFSHPSSMTFFNTIYIYYLYFVYCNVPVQYALSGMSGKVDSATVYVTQKVTGVFLETSLHHIYTVNAFNTFFTFTVDMRIKIILRNISRWLLLTTSFPLNV